MGRDYERDDYVQEDYDDSAPGSRKLLGGGVGRKKACRFCTDSEFIMDYKNFRLISTFVTEHGKLVPRRISGNCANHQRKLTIAVKRSRNLALLGFTNAGAQF
jgi:small subunit ribosomal protein S18